MAETLPYRFGSFLLLKSLGQGASGDVHLAVPADPEKNTGPLVIKRMHEGLDVVPIAMKRFEAEAEIARFIDSPHVAKVYESGIYGGTPYIAMEFIEGWSLERILASQIEARKFVPITTVIEIIEGALLGLEALHGAQDPRTKQPLAIVHRDISPKNLMLGRDGKTRLIDLGLGKSRHRDWKTAAGTLLGSPGYLAPEQLQGSDVDHRADLYAIAVVTYEILTLRPYIARGTLNEVLMRSMRPAFTPPSTHRADVPREIDEVLKKALAIDPAARFQSARELRERLVAAAPKDRSVRAISLIDELMWSELVESMTEMSRLVGEATQLVPRHRVEAPAEVQVAAPAVIAPAIVSPPAPAPSRAMKPAIGAALVAVGIAVGFVAGRMSAIPEPTPIALAEVPPVAPPPAPETPRVAPRTAPVAPIEDPPATNDRKVAAVAKKRAPVIVAEPEAPPPPEPAQPPADLKTLLRRAQQLKEKLAGTADAAAADDLFRRLLLEPPAGDEKRDQRVKDLAQQLERLEKRAGVR